MKECVSKEKRIYDLKQLLEISKILNSLLEFTHLVEAILYVAMAQTKTLGAALFTKKNAGMKKLSLSRNVCGFDVSHHAQLIISEEDPILRLLDEKACCLSPEEVQSALAPSKSVRSLLDLQPSLFVPLRAKDHLVGLILLGKKINVHEAYTPYDQSIIMDIAQLAAIAINNALLLEQATTDMMTQMKLKHYFFAMLTAKLDTLSTQETVSVLMLDIDFFKQINDTHGHLCGDLVLQHVAEIIRSCTRPCDIASRYGGEEFMLMLSNNSSREAAHVAERIRVATEQLTIPYHEVSIRVTVSAGVAEYLPNQESAETLIKRADSALYQAKQNGRNKVVISEKNMCSSQE